VASAAMRIGVALLLVLLVSADSLLARELRARGADVTFHLWPGNHDGDYWNPRVADYLKFYADACD
jgi:enterochelin esterase-like enzyme